MKFLPETKKKILSGAVVLTMVASLATAAVVALTTRADLPTLAVDGMELRLREDGSIQALLSVSGSNLEYFSGANLLLSYNKDFMEPSDWVTNQVLGSVSTRAPEAADATDALHHLFFRTAEDLYEKSDPFVWERENSGGGTELAGSIGVVKPESSTLSLVLALEDSIEAGGHIQKEASKNISGAVTQLWSYMVPDEGESKVFVGTVSFRVNADKLPELIEKFSGKEGTQIVADDGVTTLIGSYVDESITGAERKWFLQHLKQTSSRPYTWQQQQITDDRNEARFHITIDFIDALVAAEPVNDNITINAYEAYTNAQVSDLAVTMQKYADSIRVTYASGMVADQSMYWGDPATTYNMPEAGPGMLFETDGQLYRFTWAEDKVNYTLEKVSRDRHEDNGTVYYDNYVFSPSTAMTRGADGLCTYTFEDGSSFTYNARQGTYNISQYFIYEEEMGIPGSGVFDWKAYPFPMEIQLTVTPVTMTGTEMDKRVLTYPVGAVPYLYDELNLPNRAKLTLDTVLAGVTPTMYIEWNPDQIGKVKYTPAGGGADIYWPTDSTQDTADRAGDYPFAAELLRLGTETQPEGIQSTYPWMTVPEETYPLDALRRIVDKTINPDWPWAENFELQVEADDDSGDLIVNIAKRAKNEDGTYTGGYESIPEGTYTVDLYQPDGTLIDKNWFTGSGAGSSNYAEESLALGWADNETGISIRIHTDAFTGAATPRDLLQQYINLGGWFGAELELAASTDDPKPRSDRLTDYSDPRTNIYLKNYILTDGFMPALTEVNQPLFDFTGSRASLLPVYPSVGLPTLVTLPDALTADRAGSWVTTRYDASTGVEPGYIRQFKVDGWSYANDGTTTGTPGTWAGGTTVVYGENLADGSDPKAGQPFTNAFSYSGFGLVENPGNRQVKVRVELQDENEEPPVVDPNALLLTYEGTGGGIDYLHNNAFNVDEVKRVAFASRQVDYTYGQVVTLTLTNRGSEEIKGIYIDPSDTVTPGTWFTILSEPAVNLAPGASTTFQVSYLPNLAVGKYKNTNDDTVPIRIYSSAVSTTTPIKTFEATVEITQGPVHEVRLMVRPTDRSMGDAGFVSGVTADNVYDGTAMGGAYPAGAEVWVLTLPKDEFGLISAPYYYNGETEEVDGVMVPKKIYLEECLPDNLAAGSPTFRTEEGGERLFKLDEMPNRSITVYVDYYEPIYSKLRLSDLDAYAWPWERRDDPADWVETYEKELRDDLSGVYDVIAFDPDKEEYLVILNDDELSCGVAVTLRKMVVPLNALGTNIELTPVSVKMVLDDPGKTPVCDDTTGDTGVPTVHRSSSFAAPRPGESRTVTVTVSFDDTGLALGDTHIYEGERVERSYKVRFVKKYSGEPQHILHAGNSPYGMIDNDDTILDKDGAKLDFDTGKGGNAFTFTPGLTPVKAMTGDSVSTALTNMYWEEAWAADPSVNYERWKEEWLAGKSLNFDKISPALFIYIGRQFYDPGVSDIHNNAGDLIENTEVKRSLTYIPLRTTANTLARQFNNADTTAVTIELGSVTTGDGAAAGIVPGETLDLTDGAGTTVYDVRPGVYQLKYTFLDYDGVTELSFVRPLIILSGNGDVDVSRTVTTADANYIRGRLNTATPIPLASENYPEGDKLVYRYRILDANNDRNINNIDSNLIRQMVSTNGTLTQFYRPVDYINHTAAAEAAVNDTDTP